MSPYNQYLWVQVIIAINLLFISGTTGSGCNFNVKVEQYLRNNGFHRTINYRISFLKKGKVDGQLQKDCILAIYQPFPAGIFCDPNELADLQRINKLNAIPNAKINMELPAEQSEPSGVYIISKVTRDRLNLQLPTHARYHTAVAGGGTFRNEIGPPKLYLRCPDRRLDSCNKSSSAELMFLCNGRAVDKCKWKEIPFTMLTNTLTWQVPVGNTNHYQVVALGTGIVGAVGSLYLLKAIHEYKAAARRRRL